VDDTIAKLLAAGSQCTGLLASLHAKVYATASALQQQEQERDPQQPGITKHARSATVCMPFDIAAPRPKPPPQPEAMPPAPRPKPPPALHTGPTKEQLAIEAASVANRAAARARHAAVRPFKLRVLERPMHTQALRAEAERALAADLATRARARPAPPAREVDVRLNVVAVLREDAVYRRKQAQEAEELQR